MDNEVTTELDTFTPKEIRIWETKTKRSWSNIVGENVPMADWGIVYWIWKKRNEPAFTLDQAEDTTLTIIFDELGLTAAAEAAREEQD